MKDIDKYSQWTETTWVSGGNPQELAIAAIGLPGEVGEALEHIKKLLRDGKWDEQAFMKEMGDAIYYWCKILNHFGIKPSDVLKMNHEKLEDRKKRKMLQGSGDTR